MNLKLILGSTLVAAVAGIAIANSSANAVSCASSFQTNWNQEARCPGANANVASSRGLGNVGTADSQVQARLDQGFPGGLGDLAVAQGMKSNNQLAGTAPCAQGPGTPGCIFCMITDNDPSPGNSPASQKVCNQAVKHRLTLTF